MFSHTIRCNIFWFIFKLYTTIVTVFIFFPLNGGAECWTDDFFYYVGEYPAAAETGWHNDAQGVASDGHYWYITQAHGSDDENLLWKIPLSHDLGEVVAGEGGVGIRSIADTPLNNENFWHLGDLSFYNYGQGYLVVGVEGDGPGCNRALAIFRSSDLSYVTHFTVCDFLEHTPWCGVDQTGLLFSSNYDIAGNPPGQLVRLEKFWINWPLLDQTGELNWVHVGHEELLNEQGGALDLYGVQGGVFSPDGRLLYLSTFGYVRDEGDVCYIRDGGIHVFDTITWRRIERSTNGDGYFNYQYNPCDTAGAFSAPEEPEGLTIIDLNNGVSPKIFGQLHVIMLDNDAGPDDIYFKHYSRITVGQTGVFPNVTSAVDAAWEKATILIESGNYPEIFESNKRLCLKSQGGFVILGK